MNVSELYIPHTGWLAHEPDDEVARFLAEGWFEYKEQAFLRLYLRSGDTFLDCGAHFGLFSVAAGRAMSDAGIIVAVEPHPESARFLEQNLRSNGITCAQVHRTAVHSRTGSATFVPGAPGQSAYSSLALSSAGITVPTVTLDELTASANLSIDFAKIDVEGVELDVLQGAAESIRQGRLPLLMIECTENNLQRFGGNTEELFRKLEELGYVVCRFDNDLCRLVPRPYEGSIGYNNLFAAQHLDSVNRRLGMASEPARRVAKDILDRGQASDRLFRLSREAAPARTAAEDAFRAGGEANWRAEQAEKRAEAAEKRTTEARKQAQESESRAEHARKRAEELAQAIEEAYRAGGEANWRAEQAEKRAEAAEKRADEARRQAEALLRSAESSLQRVGLADARAAKAEGRTHQTQEALLKAEERAAESRLRLQELLASRYIRAGWKLRLTRKPSWVDKHGEPDRT